MLALEDVPSLEVSHRPVAGKPRPVALRSEVVEVESDEGETVFRYEAGYLGDRQTVLLHMEQEVATVARAEEVARRDDALESRGVVEEVLSASPDVLGGRLIAALGNEGARRDDIRAGDLAVEADCHKPSRPQQREQHAPSRKRIAEM